MKTKNDQYNFSLKSSNPNPGFVLFEDTETNAHYFLCNGINGLPILFSQAYQGADGASKGLKSVLKNALKKERYQLRKDNQGHFFTLKAGNHQEIARSAYAKTQKARTDYINFIKQVAKSEDPMAVAPSASPTPSLPPEEKNLSRYAFKIVFTETEEETQPYRGVIESLFNNQKQQLERVDGASISTFIKQFLPKEKLSASRQIVKPVPKVKTPSIPTLNTNLHLAGKSQQQHLVDRNTPMIQLEMEVNSALQQAVQSQISHAEIIASSMQSGNQFSIKQKDLSLNTQGNIEIALPSRNFSAGAYRLTATARIGETNPQLLTGNCFLHML